MLFFFFFIKLTGYITYGYLLSRATWRLLSLRASIKLPLHKLALIKRQQTNDSDSKKNGKNKGLKRLLLVLSTFVSFPVSEISDFSGCLEKIGVLTYRLVFDWSQRIIRLLATTPIVSFVRHRETRPAVACYRLHRAHNVAANWMTLRGIGAWLFDQMTFWKQ